MCCRERCGRGVGGRAAHRSGAVRADDVAEALQAVSPKVAKLLGEHGDVHRWVERTQALCQHLRTPTPDVSLAEVEDRARVDVLLLDDPGVVDAHVPDARKHQVLRDLIAQPRRTQQQDSRAMQPGLRFEAPQPDLSIVPLDVDRRALRGAAHVSRLRRRECVASHVRRECGLFGPGALRWQGGYPGDMQPLLRLHTTTPCPPAWHMGADDESHAPRVS